MKNNAMQSRTIIETEYAPCGLTKEGKWRSFAPSLRPYRNYERAKEELERCKKKVENNPFYPKDCKEFRVMKRTVITTISEWEDVTPSEEEVEK